ncbi:MAG: nucleotide-binding protein [Faecalibacterium sp.]|nr:nucleotide-binding protein [Faecalibacterium sp.]
MTDYERFKKIYDDIDVLIEHRVITSSQEFISWKTRAERFLRTHYGENSKEAVDFGNTHFSLMIYTFNETESDYIEACKSGLVESKAVFEVYLEELKENDVTPDNEATQDNSISKSKVFVVHGHDEALKQEVARIVEKQGLEAIILSEQANQGKTIIEKIEENADVGAAICLFTKDDYGRAKDASEDKLRARQNVVFEAGYFMGKLGRGNVIIVADKDLELPSDMQGVVYTDSKNWKIEVLQGLDKIGYAVDFNRLFKR